MENLPAISQLPLVPVMTREKFAEFAGVTPETVRGWCDKGYLPTFDMGRWSLINVALLTKDALSREWKL